MSPALEQALKPLRIQLDKGVAWFDARASRERLVLLLGAGLGVYAVFTLVFLNPLLAKREELAASMAAVEHDLTSLQERARGVATQAAKGPQATFPARTGALKEELARLQAKLDLERAGLVPPQEARRVLEDLLAAEQELQLVRLETLAPRPLQEMADDETDARRPDDPILYRHDLRLEATGDYFATLRYLRSLEAQNSGLLLEGFDYRVEEHPRARIVLELYTLSFEKAWIGV